MKGISEAAVAISALGFFGALGIWGWQILRYLKVGEWPSLSVIDVMRSLKIEWAYAPDAWIGVHKILNECPLALALIGVAVASMWAFSAADSAARK